MTETDNPKSEELTPDNRVKIAIAEIENIMIKYNVIVYAQFTQCQIPGAILPSVVIKCKEEK